VGSFERLELSDVKPFYIGVQTRGVGTAVILVYLGFVAAKRCTKAKASVR